MVTHRSKTTPQHAHCILTRNPSTVSGCRPPVISPHRRWLSMNFKVSSKTPTYIWVAQRRCRGSPGGIVTGREYASSRSHGDVPPFFRGVVAGLVLHRLPRPDV